MLFDGNLEGVRVGVSWVDLVKIIKTPSTFQVSGPKHRVGNFYLCLRAKHSFKDKKVID